MSDSEILARAIKTYGEESQIDMAIEEMSELTKALLKHRRAYKKYKTVPEKYFIENVLEEMADVQIMLDQLYMIFGEPIIMRNRKIDRLKKRLEHEDTT